MVGKPVPPFQIPKEPNAKSFVVEALLEFLKKVINTLKHNDL